jgi:predicted DNA-binding transcriptional regulator AlpA
MTKHEQIDLARIVQLASELEPRELPHFLGCLEEARQVAQLRLTPSAPAPAPPDELLSVSQVATKLGCSRDFLYRGKFPFARRLGRKLMFSRVGIEEYLRKEGR